ncbi:MAG: hypothetical protein C5B54_10500 [Acidobacteria bacterium]|nr:MAG: hypothetical protein C5B54_10500 [Acidobacteriota bacterium]
MDPISSGAVKGVQQSFVQEAEQSIQKANQQVSDFEKLRDKLEQQDSVSNPSQLDAMDKMNQTKHVDQVNQTNQVDQVNQLDPTKSASGVQQIPEIKNMDQLQGMVNNIRDGQKRLSQIISDATSGKTYSPSEMIAMQAEVGKITTDLEMATKVVENFVSSVKTTLNLQL